MLRRILDRLAEQHPEEALELTDEAVGMALDVDPDTALQLTGEGCSCSWAGAASRIPKQALLLGEVLALRAQAQRRTWASGAARTGGRSERESSSRQRRATDLAEDAERAQELSRVWADRALCRVVALPSRSRSRTMKLEQLQALSARLVSSTSERVRSLTRTRITNGVRMSSVRCPGALREL